MPIETMESIKETRKLIFDINPDFLQVSYATPYPGTDFYKIAEKEHFLNITNWDEFDYLLSPGVIKHEHLSNDELRAAMFRINRDFYLRPRYIFNKLRYMLSEHVEVRALIKASLKSLVGLLNLWREHNKSPRG